MSSWRYQPRANARPARGTKYASQWFEVGTTSTRNPGAGCADRNPSIGRQNEACASESADRTGIIERYGPTVATSAPTRAGRASQRGRKPESCAVSSISGKTKVEARVTLWPTGEGTAKTTRLAVPQTRKTNASGLKPNVSAVQQSASTIRPR